ncbi:hypothetical protein [Celeribacter sp.]|uniref:hypothetical protein n=1 Tax=Celeribacter sp. TaxID=1890673 RepID=UPI003A8DE575
MNLHIETITQLVTFGIACIGAVLGILNTWRNFRSDQVRLRITPEHAFLPGDQRDFLGIKVVNTGSPSITISDVGIELKGNKRATLSCSVLNGYQEGSLPQRLASRESAQFIIPNNKLSDLKQERLKGVYVRTACGEVFKGTSDAFRQISMWINQGKYS